MALESIFFIWGSSSVEYAALGNVGSTCERARIVEGFPYFGTGSPISTGRAVSTNGKNDLCQFRLQTGWYRA